MGIIHTGDGAGVSSTNSLPVTFGYTADSFSDTAVWPDSFTANRQVKGATTDKSIYITDIIISSVLTNTVTILDSGGTTLVRVTLAANTPFTKSWNTPKKVTVSLAVNVRTSVQAETTVSLDGFVK